MSDYEDDKYEYEDEVAEVDDKPLQLEPVELDEDTFGMSVCSLTRDVYHLSKDGFSGNRAVRLFTSLFLVLLTIIIQVWLLDKVKEFVCARSVHDIRIAYDKYELHMYGEEHCTLTVNNKHRGIKEFFPPLPDAIKKLDLMSEGDKDDICRIPLSQPYFFGLILVIWTLTCVAELRKTFHLEMVIIMLPTINSMTDSIRDGDDDTSDRDVIIQGMTICMKIGLTVLTFIPRLCVTLYLLWVGCRWLLATNAFADLILNAVALEFILLIKEGLYTSLMPTRSQMDIQVTKILPWPKELTSDWHNFVNTLLLLVVAAAWVYGYMVHWQQVLPQYNWDVHEVCVEFIKARYAV